MHWVWLSSFVFLILSSYCSQLSRMLQVGHKDTDKDALEGVN